MVKTLLLILLLIFAVSGLCEFIYFVKMLFYFPGKRVKTYTFVRLESGYALRQLEYLWQKIRWNGDSYSNGIIAINENLETKEIISCAEYIKGKNIILCSKQQITEYIDFAGEG